MSREVNGVKRSINGPTQTSMRIPKNKKEDFKNAIQKISWDEILVSNDVSFTSQCFTEKIHKTIKDFSKESRKKHKRSSLPWINENVIQMMRERGDRALQTSLKSKRITDRHIFTALRNKVTRELRKAKANYFLEIIVNSKGDSKQIWQQIKK